MPIVNFAIPKTLEKRVKQTIKTKGFTSKAEFFRVAAIDFIENNNNNDEEKEFNQLTDTLTKAIIKKYKGKKIPSIEEQLADL